MSRYPVQYHSASKGAVNIEDMASPHIANALRKMVPVTPENARLVLDMFTELEARGCTLDEATGQWTFPPKEVAE